MNRHDCVLIKLHLQRTGRQDLPSSQPPVLEDWFVHTGHHFVSFSFTLIKSPAQVTLKDSWKGLSLKSHVYRINLKLLATLVINNLTLLTFRLVLICFDRSIFAMQETSKANFRSKCGLFVRSRKKYNRMFKIIENLLNK